jgi:hypothetical protein
MRIINPPQVNEYPPYAIMYMKLVPADGLLLKHLQDGFDSIKQLIYALPNEVLYYRYAPGKWSIKQVLVHIIDDERIYA